MNKVIIFTALTLLLIPFQQNCLATDFDPLAPGATSVDGAGGNNAAEVNAAIQQSDLPDGSKHVVVSYKDGAVIIRGTALSDKDKQEIGTLAAKCGCVNIKNEVTVVPSPGASNKTPKTPRAKIITVRH